MIGRTTGTTDIISSSINAHLEYMPPGKYPAYLQLHDLRLRRLVVPAASQTQQHFNNKQNSTSVINKAPSHAREQGRELALHARQLVLHAEGAPASQSLRNADSFICISYCC